MPLLDHLIELRTRLIYCVASASSSPSSPVSSSPRRSSPFLVRPLAAALDEKRGQPDDLHRPARGVLHLCQGGVLDRRADRLPADLDAGLAVRRPRPLQERAPGLPALPDGHSDPVLHGRRAGLLRRDAGGVGVLPRLPAARRSRRPADRGRAQGRPVSVAGDAADLRLRDRLRAAGLPDAAGARRDRHRRRARRQAALRHRRGVRRRGDPDPARRFQPDRARIADHPAVRSLDFRGPRDGAQTRRARSRRGRRPHSRSFLRRRSRHARSALDQGEPPRRVRSRAGTARPRADERRDVLALDSATAARARPSSRPTRQGATRLRAKSARRRRRVAMPPP